MRLPPVVRIHAEDQDGNPAPGLVFRLQVSTGQRNPYSALFPKTNDQGLSELTADDIKGQFNDNVAEDLMGHFGNSSETEFSAVLSLFDLEQLKNNMSSVLAWPLMPHESTQWLSRKAKTEYLLSSRNLDAVFQQVQVAFAGAQSVQLRVQRRDEA